MSVTSRIPQHLDYIEQAFRSRFEEAVLDIDTEGVSSVLAQLNTLGHTFMQNGALSYCAASQVQSPAGTVAINVRMRELDSDEYILDLVSDIV